MTERPIGSIFDDPKYGKIQVVEGTSTCRGCIYADMEHRSVNCDILFTGYCHEHFRSDKKNVVFKTLTKKNGEGSEMNILETRPIGSIFTDPKFGQLKVVESKECDNCVYYYREDREDVGYCIKSIKTGFCGPKNRTDKKAVVFKTLTKRMEKKA